MILSIYHFLCAFSENSDGAVFMKNLFWVCPTNGRWVKCLENKPQNIISAILLIANASKIVSL